MYALDENLGDIHSMIVGNQIPSNHNQLKDREIEIIQILKTTVLTFTNSFIATCDAISELDW